MLQCGDITTKDIAVLTKLFFYFSKKLYVKLYNHKIQKKCECLEHTPSTHRLIMKILCGGCVDVCKWMTGV